MQHAIIAVKSEIYNCQAAIRSCFGTMIMGVEKDRFVAKQHRRHNFTKAWKPVSPRDFFYWNLLSQDHYHIGCFLISLGFLHFFSFSSRRPEPCSYLRLPIERRKNSYLAKASLRSKAIRDARGASGPSGNTVGC